MTAATSTHEFLERLFPADKRETYYRYASGIITAFTAFGLSTDKAGLWGTFAVGLLSLIFAALYTVSTVKTCVYAVVAAGAALLTAYGVARGVDWAIIVSSAAFVLGTATAAAKVQPPGAVPHEGP